MELRLAVTCDVARERPDGKLDLIGVFRERSAPAFPAIQDYMVFVAVLEWAAAETGTRAFSADLVDDAGLKVLTIEGGTEVPPPSSMRATPQTRVVLPLEEIVFPHPGHYHFDLHAGAQTIRACSVFIGEHAED